MLALLELEPALYISLIVTVVMAFETAHQIIFGLDVISSGVGLVNILRMTFRFTVRAYQASLGL